MMLQRATVVGCMRLLGGGFILRTTAAVSVVSDASTSLRYVPQHPARIYEVRDSKAPGPQRWTSWRLNCKPTWKSQADDLRPP